MEKEWSLLCKSVVDNLKKQKSFNRGKEDLLKLRKILFEKVFEVKDRFPIELFKRQEMVNSKGYDNKTMVYSIYHIARIEDIVLSDLILNKKEIFFEENFDKLTNSPIITTGNELIKKQIEEFSYKLDVEAVLSYFKRVYEESNKFIRNLEFGGLKQSFEESYKIKLLKLNVVSESENSIWLIDYWTSKNVYGLLCMPFSRHWICHVEAFLRIKNKIEENENKKHKSK